jgi:hypothetical protein
MVDALKGISSKCNSKVINDIIAGKQPENINLLSSEALQAIRTLGDWLDDPIKPGDPDKGKQILKLAESVDNAAGNAEASGEVGKKILKILKLDK